MGQIAIPDEPVPVHTLEEVLSALQLLRVSHVEDEYTLQNLIKEKLDARGIRYEKEYRLAARNRVDFFISGGIAIEVKRGKQKPNRKQVARQVERYAAFGEIQAVILVVDRNIHIPPVMHGKPCIVFGLHKLWGIAL